MTDAVVDDRPKLRNEVARVFSPLLAPARYKGAYGGRASGKSHFFAQQMVVRCYERQTRAVGIREIQKSLDQSSKLLIADKIRQLNVGLEFEVRDSYIRCPRNDSIITFQGMQNHTAESIKSLEGYTIAWFDEAHRASEFSLGLLRPTIRSPGSELWFSWNPRSPSDPIDRFLRGSPPSDAIVIEANYTDNPWIPDEAYDEMLYDRRRDMERFYHVWCGKYQSRSESLVFRNWTVDEFETPSDPSPTFYHGCDWGFAKDPTVLVRCFVEGRKLYVDQEAWKIGCEIDRTPDLFDWLDFENPLSARKWNIVADSSNPQAISYMRRNGYPKMTAAVKGKNSVEEGIEFLKSYDIVVHPRCTHVIDELSSYSYEIDKLTEQVLPKLEDKKNHTIDALRYAVEGIRRKPMRAMWGSY